MRYRRLTFPLLVLRFLVCLVSITVLLGGCSVANRRATGETETTPEKTALAPATPSDATDSSTESDKPAAPISSTKQPTRENQPQPEQAPSEAIDARARKAAMAFASDISNDNPQVIERVTAAFETAPRDPEVVGFYLDSDASDFEVAFRTAVTALNDSNFVISLENKYANELLSSMLNNELIFPHGVEVNQQIGTYIEQLAYGMELGPDDFELDEPIFAEAVQTVETNANDNGVYFLELNLGSSDTRFIIPTNQTNYERWVNVAFDRELAVEKLTWATIWDDIAYNIYDTDTYNLPGILNYEKPDYRDATELVAP